MGRILLICLILTFTGSWAQDTVYFKNSEKLAVILLEVNPENIKYKRFDNQAGATYTVLKSDLLWVVLSNGKKEVFEKPVAANEKKDSLVTDTAKTETAKFSNEPDTLIFKSGKISVVKILHVLDRDIKYKLFTYMDGPTYQASKSEISEIIFASGIRQRFEEQAAPPPNNVNSANNQGNSFSMYQKGKEDAKRYYKHPGGSVTTGCTTSVPCFGIGLGLIPAIIFANQTPKNKDLNMPVSSYSKNSDYMNGYQTQAHQIKKKKVWAAYGLGTAISLTLLAALAFIQ